MKKNEENCRLKNPHLRALQMLKGTKLNPHPRLAWDLAAVMPSDLIKKEDNEESVNKTLP